MKGENNMKKQFHEKYILVETTEDGPQIRGIFKTVKEIAEALGVSVHVAYRVKEGFYTRRLVESKYAYDITERMARFNILPLSAMQYICAK